MNGQKKGEYVKKIMKARMKINPEGFEDRFLFRIFEIVASP